MTDAMTAIVLIGGILALFITITWILFPFILIGKLNEILDELKNQPR
jgi:hypothetical protein